MSRFQSRGARVRKRARLRPAASDDGYVAIDAIVALLILSLATILSLQAVQTAYQVATAADEYRRADVLLTYILENGPCSFAPSTGQDDGFSWRLLTQTTGFDRPIAVCRRALTVTADGTGRIFLASTLETCPVESPA